MIMEIDTYRSLSGKYLVHADNVEIASFDTYGEAAQFCTDVAA